MKARRCQGCGAPLPDADPAEPVRCTFCDLRHDRSGPGSGGVSVSIGAASRPAPRWVFWLITAIVLLAVIPTAIGIFVAWRAANAVAPLVSEAVTRTPTRPAARTTADLHDLPGGHHALDVAPPAGGYGAVDPIAALPWAVAIAQAWDTGARLTRIDVSRLRPDGTINVQDDATATLRYRFMSPGRAEALRQQGRLRADAEAVVGFWVTVETGQVRAFGDATRATSLRDTALPTHPQALALPALFARPAVQRLADGLPFLNGYLIAIEREDWNWAWYFSSLANESLPRVRARDGAVWPYGR